MQRAVYMKLKTFFIAVILATMALQVSDGAVVKSVVKDKNVTGLDQSAGIGMPLMSFDPSVTRLPANYTGTNIISVFHKLHKEIPEKNELETQESFNKRVADTIPKDFYAFVKDNDNNQNRRGEWDHFRSLYNPETQMMVGIYAPVTGRYDFDPYGDELETHVNVMIKRSSQTHAVINKSKSLGVKVKVSNNRADDYGLTLTNDNAHIKREILFFMSPEDARLSRNDIALLILSKIAPHGKSWRVTRESVDSENPASSTSQEYHKVEHFVYAKAYELWVFNKKTGVVYAMEVIEDLDK